MRGALGGGVEAATGYRMRGLKKVQLRVRNFTSNGRGSRSSQHVAGGVEFQAKEEPFAIRLSPEKSSFASRETELGVGGQAQTLMMESMRGWRSTLSVIGGFRTLQDR